MTVSSKIRLYDLALELKLDTKRLIEEVRREGVDVSVPSNSVSYELAEKIRNKYFPKKETIAKRGVRVVKKAERAVEEAPSIETAPKLPPVTESKESNSRRIFNPPTRLVKKLEPAIRKAPLIETTPELPPVTESKESDSSDNLGPTARLVKKLEPPVRKAPSIETMPERSPVTEILQELKSSHSEDNLLPLSIDAADDVLEMVRQLVPDYAGVILTGPPGTSKTWYARQIAAALTDRDRSRVRFVQFHQSYQYEDFVEGYVPREDGNGFQLRPKHLLEMCEVARAHEDQTCVMIIDELSRSDPGRVFGEALTYIEPTQREVEFYLASGNPAKLPRNLFFLATMNPLDRGVDEVDAALDRRFAKIAMEPSPDRLVVLLDQNGLDAELRNSVVKFFRFLLNNPNERCRVGHAYFRAVRTAADLRRLWDHQLRFHMAKAFKLDNESFRNIEREWSRAVADFREPRR